MRKECSSWVRFDRSRGSVMNTLDLAGTTVRYEVRRAGDPVMRLHAGGRVAIREPTRTRGR
jgi:hypothetical protein